MELQDLTKIMRQVFVLSRYWEGILDAGLKQEGITSKQLLLLGIIERDFPAPLSISKAAERTLTSHQNVMQMAKTLERRGFLRIEQDENDRRVRKLHLTDANEQFWKKRGDRDTRALGELFSALSETDKRNLKKALDRLVPHTAELYEKRNEQ